MSPARHLPSRHLERNVLEMIGHESDHAVIDYESKGMSDTGGTFSEPGTKPAALPAQLCKPVVTPRHLQGTYAARFNARHRLAGHLFAGRYKAVLVEREEPAYGRVVSDYIHLKPARAGIVNAENPRLRPYRGQCIPLADSDATKATAAHLARMHGLTPARPRRPPDPD